MSLNLIADYDKDGKFIFSLINQGLKNGYIEKSKWIYGELFLDQEDV